MSEERNNDRGLADAIGYIGGFIFVSLLLAGSIFTYFLYRDEGVSALKGWLLLVALVVGWAIAVSLILRLFDGIGNAWRKLTSTTGGKVIGASILIALVIVGIGFYYEADGREETAQTLFYFARILVISMTIIVGIAALLMRLQEFIRNKIDGKTDPQITKQAFTALANHEPLEGEAAERLANAQSQGLKLMIYTAYYQDLYNRQHNKLSRRFLVGTAKIVVGVIIFFGSFALLVYIME